MRIQGFNLTKVLLVYLNSETLVRKKNKGESMNAKSFKRAGYSQEEAHFYSENLRLMEAYRKKKKAVTEAAEKAEAKAPATKEEVKKAA